MRRVLVDLIAAGLVLFIVEFPALINVIDYKSVIGIRLADESDVGDAELIHRHSPYWRFVGASKGGNIADGIDIPSADQTSYRWDVRYDRNGFRNQRDLTNADIAVIGDSFIESVVRPEPQLLTSILAGLQGKIVANLGQYGYGPIEELAVLKRYALPLHPQLVVWTFFEGNDLGDMVHYHKVIAARAAASGASVPRAKAWWAAFRDRSFTHNAILELRKLRQRRKPPGVNNLGVVVSANGKQTNMYFGYKSGPLPDDYLAALDETFDILRTASDLCAAQGTRFVVVFIPEKFRVFQPLCRFPRESECRNWTLSDLPERLQNGIHSAAPEAGYLDLTPVFADAAARGVMPYDRDDTHWSTEGEQMAALTLNEYLQDSAKPSSASNPVVLVLPATSR